MPLLFLPAYAFYIKSNSCITNSIFIRFNSAFFKLPLILFVIYRSLTLTYTYYCVCKRQDNADNVETLENVRLSVVVLTDGVSGAV